MAVAKSGPPINIPFFIPGTQTIDNSWIQWFNNVDLATGGVSGLGGLADQDGGDAADDGLTGSASTLAVDIAGTTAGTIADDDEIMFADVSESDVLRKTTAGDINALSQGVLQIRTYTTNEELDATTAIPIDDTTPQNTDGDEYMNVSFTPKSSSSTLYFWFTAFGNSTSQYASATIFKENEADAFGVTTSSNPTNHVHPINLVASRSSNANIPAQYKIRVGPNSGTLRMLQGFSATAVFNNLGEGRLIILEYEDRTEL